MLNKWPTEVTIEGKILKPEELETIVTALRELGESHEETAKLMKGVTEDTKALRPLWGKSGAGAQKTSQLIQREYLQK